VRRKKKMPPTSLPLFSRLIVAGAMGVTLILMVSSALENVFLVDCSIPEKYVTLVMYYVRTLIAIPTLFMFLIYTLQMDAEK
jgi:hypothetical protein